MKTFFLLLISVHMALSVFTIRRIAYEKVPMNDELPYNYQYLSGSAEEAAYDPIHRQLYIVGDHTNILHIFDTRSISHPQIAFSKKFDVNIDGHVLDVEVCGNKLALAFKGKYDSLDGHIELFDTFLPGGSGITQIGIAIAVGAYPDNMKFSPDCNYLVVANEGRPSFNGPAGQPGTAYIDPEGTVSVLDLHTSTPEVKTYTFTGYNDDQSMMRFIREGGRYVWKGNHTAGIINTLSQDLEPEYVTISDDNRYAYVSIQENNAMAKIDLLQKTLLSMHGLGTKNWTDLGIDPSDHDHIEASDKYNMFSFYQPDTIKYVNINGSSYVITLDEGATKTLEDVGIGFTDTERASILSAQGRFDQSEMDPAIYEAVKDNARLGRLFVGEQDGIVFQTGGTGEPLIGTLYHMGGRGFSLMDVNQIYFARKFDSGSEIEDVLRTRYYQIFNGRATNRNARPTDERDNRSPFSGPELNGLATVTLRSDLDNMDHLLLFVGDENTNVIFQYELAEGTNGVQGNFIQAYREGEIDSSWQNLYDTSTIGDTGICDMGYIPDPSGFRPGYLYVIGAQSGTLAIYQIIDS